MLKRGDEKRGSSSIGVLSVNDKQGKPCQQGYSCFLSTFLRGVCRLMLGFSVGFEFSFGICKAQNWVFNLMV